MNDWKEEAAEIQPKLPYGNWKTTWTTKLVQITQYINLKYSKCASDNLFILLVEKDGEMARYIKHRLGAQKSKLSTGMYVDAAGKPCS